MSSALVRSMAKIPHFDLNGQNHFIGSDAITEKQEQLIIRGNTDLNVEQRRAIAAMLCGAGRVGSPPFVLFGPPGNLNCWLRLLLVAALIKADTFLDYLHGRAKLSL